MSAMLTALVRSRACTLANPKRIAPVWIGKRHRGGNKVALLPEVPADTADTNSLLRLPLETSQLLQWSKISERMAFNGMGKALLLFETAVVEAENKCKDGVTDFDAIFGPLEEAKVKLDTLWNSFNLMHMATEVIEKEIYLSLNKRVEKAFYSRYGSEHIYETLVKVQKEHEKRQHLNKDQERVLERYLREYQHNGFSLPEKKKEELSALWMRKVLACRRDYNFRHLLITERFRSQIRDPQVVKDFPLDVLKAMALDSSQPSKGPWTVTLHPYIYNKFMEYCPVRRHRWNVHLGDVTRGSPSYDPNTDVTVYAKDLRIYRTDQAITLGYDNYAEKVLTYNMAGSAENVNFMIASMLGSAKEAQERELSALQEFADSRDLQTNLALYDVPFYQREQKRVLYGYDDEDLRDFFPLPKVLSTIFNLLQNMFDVVIEENRDQRDTAWHSDVKLFRVIDGTNSTLIGQFYFDPYLRDDKVYAGGDKGYYIPIQANCDRGKNNPVGAMLLSLPAPAQGKPSLLNFNETKELFGLTGSMLLHMLSANPWSDLTGKIGIEYDAIEVASLFMKEWLYTPEVLTAVSGHWSSNESLSPEIIEGLSQARQHMAGYHLCTELYKASCDLTFFTESHEKHSVEDITERLYPQYLLIPREKEDYFPYNFCEIFGGQLSGIYYSQTWSNMLAADAFSAVKEVGLENSEDVKNVTRRFRHTFLSTGSALPAADVFRQFRGRDPSHEALLFNLGLISRPKPKKKAAITDEN